MVHFPSYSAKMTTHMDTDDIYDGEPTSLTFDKLVGCGEFCMRL